VLLPGDHMTELPNADTLLDDLLVIDDFIPHLICDSLVARIVDSSKRRNGLTMACRCKS
jgi:hypothetical protein